jgi:hypothetical protein
MVEGTIDEDAIIAAISKKRGRRTKKVAEDTEKTDKELLKENQKRLKLLRLGNKWANLAEVVRKESVAKEEKLNKARKKQVGMIEKYIETYKKKQKDVLLGGLKRSLALDAEGGPEAEDDKGKKGKGIGVALKAAGILLLVAALHKATAQSKIIGVINSSISKALGLFIDLVLLPFLPLITAGIINLYTAIMEWNKEYQADPLGGILKRIPQQFIEGFSLLMGPEGPLIVNIGKWFVDNILTPTVPVMIDAYNNFVTDFNDFFKDGGGLSHAITGFVDGVATKIDDIMKGFVNYLLGLPVIGDILRAAGVGHQNLSIPEVSNEEYKKVYAERNKEAAKSTPNVEVSTHIASGSSGNIPVQVHVQTMVDGKWIDDKIERVFANMTWDQKAANWGTM